MTKSFRLGFISDPLEHYDPVAETTLFLMREGARRGATIYQWEPKDIFLQNDRVWGNVKKLEIPLSPTLSLQGRGGHKILPLDAFDCIFLRKDPPFDLPYLHHLYIMMRLEGKTLMVNRPSGILAANEKLLALDFPFHPPTCVASDLATLQAFARKSPTGVVLKPLALSGGEGIVFFKKGVVPKKLPTVPMICQQFIPEIKKFGDKRILLFNGKILGAFARFPKPGEFRANLHQGGHFRPATITTHDKKIVRAVLSTLKKLGLYFVGLDVIGPYLTEINVTSPMGIHEINETQSVQCEQIIFDELNVIARRP